MLQARTSRRFPGTDHPCCHHLPGPHAFSLAGDVNLPGQHLYISAHEMSLAAVCYVSAMLGASGCGMAGTHAACGHRQCRTAWGQVPEAMKAKSPGLADSRAMVSRASNCRWVNP